MNLKTALISVILLLGSLVSALNYMEYLTCVQKNCFSLNTYCNKDDKCKRSLMLVYLCSSVNPTQVDVCVGNIHNYLHISLASCLSTSCGFNEYFTSCGMNYFQADQCINDPTSECYISNNTNGAKFTDSVTACVAKNIGSCDNSLNYSEYFNRCSSQVKYACYTESLSSASDAFKSIVTCSEGVIQKFVILAGLIALIML